MPPHKATIPLEGAKHLCIPKALSEVDVEQVPRLLQHDVVVVTVAYPQHIGGHTVPGTGAGEVVHSLHRKEWLGNHSNCRRRDVSMYM